MIYTNLDTNNMVDEIRDHLKNVNNIEYIEDYINTQYLYGFITQEERIMLFKEYEV